MGHGRPPPRGALRRQLGVGAEAGRGGAGGASGRLVDLVGDGHAVVAEEADPPGEIYNSGAALSEEALTAFLAEVGDRRVIRRVELDPADVPEEARADWFYGSERQSLVICSHPDGRVGELFRRVGRAAFKGLGGVTVWELCAEQGGPAQLVRLLGRSWFQERPAAGATCRPATAS